MAKIVWREKISIGVPAIDDDHKALIEHINTLDTAINAAVYDAKAVALTLLRLIEYSKEHFEREEWIMASVRYPGLPEHRQEHAKAIKALNTISLEFTAKPTRAVAESIYNFTTDWLVNHIILSDSKITPYTKVRPVALVG